MIEIKHRLTGKILHRVDADTLADADLRGTNLAEAKLFRADLIGADLHEADLSGADLTGATLAESILVEANLTGAILEEAILIEAKLFMANLSGADLSRADLSEADLSGAHLEEADMSGANLHGVYLTGAALRGADLAEAKLFMADLRGAELAEAKLFRADLTQAHLSDVDFTSAQLGFTIFSFCDDLHKAKGLEKIVHLGPSALDAHTLRASIEYLPDVFLEGVGYTREEIDYLRPLYRKSAIEFYSCFISYSQKDEEFATHLHDRLRAANIRTWYSPEDMPYGSKLHEEIDQAIRLHDRLLIILTENSMNSQWVNTEIRKARKAEMKEGRRKLFPISLVPYEKIQEWEAFNANIGEDMADEIREYLIPDFSKWKDHDDFEHHLPNCSKP